MTFAEECAKRCEMNSVEFKGGEQNDKTRNV